MQSLEKMGIRTRKVIEARQIQNCIDKLESLAVENSDQGRKLEI
jgi:hypothetical protein